MQSFVAESLTPFTACLIWTILQLVKALLFHEKLRCSVLRERRKGKPLPSIAVKTTQLRVNS